MIKYPQPIPFSPTQEDLDRLVTALTPEHQAKADKKAEWDESEQVAKLISWDRDHSVRYLFKDLFSSSNIGIKNAAISFLVSALIVPLRTLFFPFRLLVRLVLIPSRPARPINNRTPGRFTPLHLEAGAIRRFDDIVDAVFIYEKAYDDRLRPAQTETKTSRRVILRRRCSSSVRKSAPGWLNPKYTHTIGDKPPPVRQATEGEAI